MDSNQNNQPVVRTMDSVTAAVFDRAAERLEAQLGAQPVFVLLATQPGMPEELVAIQQELGALSDALTAGDVSPATLSRLEQAEQDLLDLDDATPDAVVFATLRQVPEDAAVHYARLLAGRLSPHRMERVVAVMTQLCTGPDGAVLPFDGVKHILLGLGARSEVTLETMGTGVAFFEAASQRLASLETLDALFDSGFIMDVSGYRLSLRNQLLEPEILYASLRLQRQFISRVHAAARAGGVSPDGVARRLAAANAKVDEVFKIARRAGSAQDGFVARRKRTPAAATSPAHTVALPAASSPSHGLWSRRGLLALFLAAGIPAAAVSLYVWSDTHLDGMGAAQLRELSDVLVEGGVSDRGVPRVFIGRVDGGRWMTLSRSDRLREARQIQDRLATRGIRTGLVSRDGALVLRIENGTLMQVE